jgi:branched-chain amino acid transport system ATP-binding protein
MNGDQASSSVLAQPLLNVHDLRVEFGGVIAVDGLNLSVQAGQTVTILGANGAGKTSTLRTIGGLLRPRRGQIRFDGRRVDGVNAEELTRKGLVSVTDTRDLFPRFTVEENLRIGAITLKTSQYSRRREEVLALFPALERLVERPAWTLSGGEQQMLALGRALLLRPRLLLLDEPSLGLAPRLVESIFTALARVSASGVAILLVEQVSASALALAEYAYVLRAGTVVLEGPSASIRTDPRVVEAYLGGGAGPTGGEREA